MIVLGVDAGHEEGQGGHDAAELAQGKEGAGKQSLAAMPAAQAEEAGHQQWAEDGHVATEEDRSRRIEHGAAEVADPVARRAEGPG